MHRWTKVRVRYSHALQNTDFRKKLCIEVGSIGFAKGLCTKEFN